MSRLIDADELIIMGLDNPDDDNLFEFVPLEFINNAETVDAIEVVRCRDCRHASPNGLYGCDLKTFTFGNRHRMRADDFCSMGEKGDRWKNEQIH